MLPISPCARRGHTRTGGNALQAIPYRIRTLSSRELLANPQGSQSNGTPMIQREDTGETDQDLTFDPPLGQAVASVGVDVCRATAYLGLHCGVAGKAA